MLLLALYMAAPVVHAVEVVVNRSVTPQSFSRHTIRAIFGMRLPTWPDGTPIQVFVLPNEHPLHVAFSKEILHTFPYQLRLAWDRLVFSGTGQAPMQVSSESEMYKRVATTPGAIGYLPETMIDENVRTPEIN